MAISIEGCALYLAKRAIEGKYTSSQVEAATKTQIANVLGIGTKEADRVKYYSDNFDAIKEAALIKIKEIEELRSQEYQSLMECKDVILRNYPKATFTKVSAGVWRIELNA